MADAKLHEAFGGTAAWRQLAVAFYARVAHDPLLRPLFPGKTFRCAIEEFTAFLVQFFDGPAEDSQRRWWLSLRESHMRFRIGPEERAAWMVNMVKALDDVALEEPLRGALREFFAESSAYVVNMGEPVSGAEACRSNGEIARRWEEQRGLDEAVAAVRSGEAERAIAAAEKLRPRFEKNRSVLVGLVALMMGSRNPHLLRYARERVTQDPSLVRERYAGRTLLHAASAAGDAGTVELLLQLDADANALDGGKHTPLYSVANEYKAAGGGEVVRALVRGGADVNANAGAKRCTALHMAARRGNVEVATALLDCGADVDVRDRLGATPLRRAMNCGQMEVAAVLLARGANAHSKGSVLL